MLLSCAPPHAQTGTTGGGRGLHPADNQVHFVAGIDAFTLMFHRFYNNDGHQRGVAKGSC